MLAAATRNTGILLLLPLGVMYLQQAREPRIRADVAWLALVPLGLVGFFTYLHFHTGDAFASLEANRVIWGREIEPLGGAVAGSGGRRSQRRPDRLSG